eukprot:TRINITY_DN38294_c0_g1_i1.p1 TRINITY_DN38294_c0_g1~~TRINITY_DN38294_c0_g1_i1.p1  ORF type:complete len:480 (+),score=56.80 TRINITY_DN38294_c0_g1_i1:68-1507(+)
MMSRSAAASRTSPLLLRAAGRRQTLPCNSRRLVSSFTPIAASRVGCAPESVWTEFTPLALKHSAINLSQGVPSIPVSDFVLQCLTDATAGAGPSHQYCRPAGLPRLVKALAQQYAKPLDREIDPLSEVLVSTGATQALYVFFQCFINPGDEVILLEPFYDCYTPQVKMCGGHPVYVPLIPPSTDTNVNSTSTSAQCSSAWRVDMAQLEAAFSRRTKAIVLNNPHNPTGKIFSPAEIKTIGALAEKHDAIIVSDEVYEYLDYSSLHVKTASLPGLWDRTVTFGSVGKAFNTTGWKIGWALGPSSIIAPMQILQQYIPFCVTTPLQESLALMFEREREVGFFAKQLEEFDVRRKMMVAICSNSGLAPTNPQGSYFVLADTSTLTVPPPADWQGGAGAGVTARPPIGERADYDFCRWLTMDIGVAAIPPSAFYSHENAHIAAKYVRFCFAKSNENIEEAGERMLRMLPQFARKMSSDQVVEL